MQPKHALILLVLLCTAANALAQTATVTLNRQRVYVGDEIGYTITITDTRAADLPKVDFPASVSGRFVNSAEQSTSTIRIINGERRRVRDSTFTYQYSVLAREPGSVTIPGSTITLADGSTVTTEPVRFEALLPQPAPNFAIQLTAPRDTVYIGETFTATVEWLMPESVRGANFDASVLPANAVVTPSVQPKHRAGQLIDFKFLGQDTIGTIEDVFTPSGQRQTRFRFELQVTPTQPGPIALGPVRVVFDRATPTGGFTRVYTESEPLSLSARPLPTANQPAGFDGLIGTYELSAQASTGNADVGDPITLTARLTGDEPMTGGDQLPDLSTLPEFASNFRFSPDGWALRRTSETGERVFITTIRALNPELTEIPSIPLVAFDPSLGIYTDVTSEPIPLTVRAVREATVADAVVSPGRAVERADNRPELQPDNPAFWAPPTADAIAADRPFDLAETLRQPVTVITLASGPTILAASACVLAYRRRREDPKRRRDRSLRTAEHLAVRTSPDAAARAVAAELLACDPDAVTLSDINRIPAHPGVTRTLREAFAPSEGESTPPPSPKDTALAIRTLRRSLRKAGPNKGATR